MSQFWIKVKIILVIFYSLKNVYLNKIKMLYNDRTDVSVGTDINETSVIFVTIEI